jgi:hypothetical protein
MKERWRFYYVHRDGWLTDDINKALGKCVGVVEARSEEEALRLAKERELL